MPLHRIFLRLQVSQALLTLGSFRRFSASLALSVARGRLDGVEAESGICGTSVSVDSDASKGYAILESCMGLTSEKEMKVAENADSNR